MNIAQMIFDGVSGTSVVMNNDAYPVHDFSMEIETRKEEFAKVASHGIWSARTFLGQRRITVEGTIMGQGVADYMAKRMVLMGSMMPVPELGNMKVGTLRLQIDGIPEEISIDCNLDGEPTLPVSTDSGTPDSGDFQIQFLCDDPLFYSTAILTAQTGTPTGGGGGLTFPMTFPFDFTGGGGGGDVNVVNNGNATVYPQVIIYGPCSAPQVSIIINGITYSLRFQGLVLSSTEYVTIDFKARTVISSTGGSLYQLIAPGSTWWTIPPGTWSASYRAGSVAAPSKAVIYSKNAYMF